MDVIVSIDEASAFTAVVARLRAAGLNVRSSMPNLGTVAGTVADDRLADLQRIPGVLAVESERTIDIGPPGADDV